ncbi:MAG TPA: sulfotransferase, partial [Myxococcota bacterium]|nr:sulfotransferase [Myxococcota bacterium]
MISRLLLVYSIVRKRFGFYFRPLFVFVLLAVYRLFIGLCLLLDPIFFPALAKKEVKAPIFIVGNPRSGTT